MMAAGEDHGGSDGDDSMGPKARMASRRGREDPVIVVRVFDGRDSAVGLEVAWPLLELEGGRRLETEWDGQRLSRSESKRWANPSRRDKVRACLWAGVGRPSEHRDAFRLYLICDEMTSKCYNNALKWLVTPGSDLRCPMAIP